MGKGTQIPTAPAIAYRGCRSAQEEPEKQSSRRRKLAPASLRRWGLGTRGRWIRINTSSKYLRFLPRARTQDRNRLARRRDEKRRPTAPPRGRRQTVGILCAVR